jgi:hypothetical protein
MIEALPLAELLLGCLYFAAVQRIKTLQITVSSCGALISIETTGQNRRQVPPRPLCPENGTRKSGRWRLRAAPLPVDSPAGHVIQAPKPEPRTMHTNSPFLAAIKPMLPNKPRGFRA